MFHLTALCINIQLLLRLFEEQTICGPEVEWMTFKQLSRDQNVLLNRFLVGVVKVNNQYMITLLLLTPIFKITFGIFAIHRKNVLIWEFFYAVIKHIIVVPYLKYFKGSLRLWGTLAQPFNTVARTDTLFTDSVSREACTALKLCKREECNKYVKLTFFFFVCN